MSHLWRLVVVSIGMTLIPGIDTAMVLRVTLRGGRADGLRTAQFLPASTAAALPTALALAATP